VEAKLVKSSEIIDPQPQRAGDKLSIGTFRLDTGDFVVATVRKPLDKVSPEDWKAAVKAQVDAQGKHLGTTFSL